MQLKKFLLIGTVVASLATVVSGCAYRTDLAQGNFVEQEAVDKLRQGMTAEQVRFILGTPMLTDSFDDSRWYYVHYLRQDWNQPKIQNLIVHFENRTLVDISGDFKKPLDFYSGQNSVQKIDLSQFTLNVDNNESQEPQKADDTLQN